MGSLKNTLLAVSAGVVLGSPAQARSNPNVTSASDGIVAVMSDARTVDSTREKSSMASNVEWVTRVPVGSGFRTEKVDSLEAVLKNPSLKDHIYASGAYGFQTPLACATLNNDLDLMHQCLDAGVNPDIGRIGQAPGPDSPLAKAVNNYSRLKKDGQDVSVQKEQIESLLKAGANPNIVTSYSLPSEKGYGYEIQETRTTPLHQMAELRDDQMISLLVAHGADTSAKSAGRTPLDVYNSEITEVSGEPLAWRGEKNKETAEKLKPQSQDNALFGWLAKSGGR